MWLLLNRCHYCSHFRLRRLLDSSLVSCFELLCDESVLVDLTLGIVAVPLFKSIHFLRCAVKSRHLVVLMSLLVLWAQSVSVYAVCDMSKVDPVAAVVLCHEEAVIAPSDAPLQSAALSVDACCGDDDCSMSSCSVGVLVGASSPHYIKTINEPILGLVGLPRNILPFSPFRPPLYG